LRAKIHNVRDSKEFAKWGGGGTHPICALTENSRKLSKENMGIAIVPLCQHRIGDARCGSPAKRGKRYCYFHQREHQRGARRKSEQARQKWFESVALDDANAVQKALTQVMQRLASGQIEHKNAGQILYKLQIASMNLRKVSLDP